MIDENEFLVFTEIRNMFTGDVKAVLNSDDYERRTAVKRKDIIDFCDSPTKRETIIYYRTCYDIDSYRRLITQESFESILKRVNKGENNDR